MDAKDDGGPAFPAGLRFMEEGRSIAGAQLGRFENVSGGMTLRDYFAAHAPVMPDIWAQNQDDAGTMDPATFYAKWCYDYADALLKARRG